MSEGRGESQPAAHSPEFGVPNGSPPIRAGHHSHAHRGRLGAAQLHSNGHAARTEGALGVHDVLSGEDSAPDTGRAVTSPAPGSTPGETQG